MSSAPTSPVLMKTPGANHVMDYFRELAARNERPSSECAFQGLAQLFDAGAIGVCCPDGTAADLAFSPMLNPPPTYPWQTDASLISRARTSLAAVSVTDGSGAWLVCCVPEPAGETRIVWAHRAGSNAWADDEAWLWTFASQVLMRWLGQLSPSDGGVTCLKRRLELSAVVTSRLSHDFGNYLTGIMGFTELSLSQASADSMQQRFLCEVLQSAKQGAEWIRRLHLFCRRGVAQAWPTLLSSVLAEEEACLRAAGVLNMRWEVRLPADLPLLAIDAGSLQTALTELVNNTREATSDQGILTFSARPVELTAADCRDLLGSARPGRYVEITATDSGPGISANVRAKLFGEVFFSTKPRHRGLGLLIIYGIMQRFGGALRLDESKEGQGVCVHLYVPVAPIEGPALTTPTGPPHLLLIHAKPLLFDSLRRIVEARGCRVSEGGASPSAVGTYASPGESFALVVIETSLPQMSGFDLARRILEVDPKANFLFLHTSPSFHGLAEEELVKRFDMLRWPLEPHGLLQAVQTALTRANRV